MSEKTIRYITWASTSLVVIAFLFIRGRYSFGHGLFTSEIEYTMVFNFVEHFVSSYLAIKRWGYFLWFVCLGGGLFISWKYRFKTASIISNVFKNINEKV
jgi:hypothetical protein